MLLIKRKKNAFSIVELIVVITLIGIITLSFNNLNIIKIADRQKVDIFTNKIMSNIETMRNNSLIGKGLSVGLDPIYETEITLTDIGVGELIVKYNTGSGLPFLNSNFSLVPSKSYGIKRIECLKIDGTLDSPSTTSSGVINIIGQTMKLSGCPLTSKKLRIRTYFQASEKDFIINTVSGLVIKL